MPRQLAILIFTALVVWLWRADARTRPRFSKALWIPFIWLVLLGSRPLSWWSSFFFGIGGGTSNLEGNALDRVLYSCLIFASILIVWKRGVSLTSVLSNNWGLVLFWTYLAVTVLWAEYPFATVKRWIKEVGALPVLLVILTEDKPLDALKTVFTRLGYVLFSYSVLVIKYIPELGRDYSSHSGVAQIIGVTAQKNSLGTTAMVGTLLILWQLGEYYKSNRGKLYRAPALQWVIATGMGLWLLYQSNSKTSMVCLGVALTILILSRFVVSPPSRRALAIVCIAAIPIFLALDSLFDIRDPLLQLLGRDPTLTNRTAIWAAVLKHPVDPVLGSGYLNYWDAFRVIELGSSEVELTTAHNGYLETYLDGGIVGLVVLFLMLLHVSVVHGRAFIQIKPFGALGLAILTITLLANVSESLFARRGPSWALFLISCLITSGVIAVKSHEPKNEELESGVTGIQEDEQGALQTP